MEVQNVKKTECITQNVLCRITLNTISKLTDVITAREKRSAVISFVLSYLHLRHYINSQVINILEQICYPARPVLLNLLPLITPNNRV